MVVSHDLHLTITYADHSSPQSLVLRDRQPSRLCVLLCPRDRTSADEHPLTTAVDIVDKVGLLPQIHDPPLTSVSSPQWFCPPCTFSSPKNVTTYKIPPRKSQRSTRQQIDYANLNAHIPSDPDRWQRVLASRTVIEGAFREMTGKEMNEAWLWGEESLREPVVIQDEEGLGMTMPSRDITVGQVSEAVGPTTPIEVIGESIFILAADQS
jgi:hypothetical protein